MDTGTPIVSADNKNSVGEMLKQGRLRQRLSVAECAKRTHIAARFIEALEDEKWDVLPSESHRLGFLRLYARFLGVSADDVLARYSQQLTPTPKEDKASSETAKVVTGDKEIKPTRAASPVRTAPRPAWTPSSLPQLIGLTILLLVLGWVLYHTLQPRLFEQNQLPWTRRKATAEARLHVPQRAQVQVHKVRLKAIYDCWLRVTSNNVLLFEGILPAGAVKEWSGNSPFDFKIGNVRSLELFWNDQPVDISVNSQGSTNKIRIPPQ